LIRQGALTLGQVDAARESLLKAKEAAKAQEECAILWKILVASSAVHLELGTRTQILHPLLPLFFYKLL
jgi:hypothetical protein